MNDKQLNQLKNEENQHVERSSNVLMAGIFIVVGGILIANNVTGLGFSNWWVLFMLVPLAMFLRNVVHDYRANGRLTAHSIGSIIASLAILVAAATFLFEALTWSMIWPVGLIFAGVAIFLGNRS